MDYDVLVIGGVGIDTIVRLADFPDGYRDSVGVPPIRDYVAHTGNGVALGCHTLGLRTRLLDVIGDDPQGHLIRETYRRIGLDVDFVTHPSGTRRSVILVDDAGRRMSFYDGRHPADLRVAPEFYRPSVDRARLVHVSIMGFARHLVDDVLASGRPVSTDLHDWDGRAEHHRPFAYAADLVFLSTAALGDRIAEVTADVLARGRAAVVVAMAGADGSYLRARGEDLVHVPVAELGLPIVDSNGAGDSYVAGFLAGYLGGADWLTCARYGAIAGAYACSQAGTHTAFIDADQLNRYTAGR